MLVEDSNDDFLGEPRLSSVDELWLYWSYPPPGLAGRELRRAVFASFASALQGRWPYGGYNFQFLEDARPAAPPDDDTPSARALLSAAFPRGRLGAFDFAWREPAEALDEYLDSWLFFRHHRPYVYHDDTPPSMAPVLREPWAACVGEATVGAKDARAAVVRGENLADNWGDHGVALVLAAGVRLCVFHVGLCTD